MSNPPFSETLAELIECALEHGVDSVSTGEPLIPFVMYDDTAGERQLQRHFAPTDDGQGIDLDASVASAKKFANGLAGKAFRATVVVDGRIADPTDGQKRDCLLAFGYEDGEPEQVILGQIYFPAKGLRKFSIRENLVLLGTEAPMW